MLRRASAALALCVSRLLKARRADWTCALSAFCSDGVALKRSPYKGLLKRSRYNVAEACRGKRELVGDGEFDGGAGG